MKEIGAFEAKNKLADLLKQVEEAQATIKGRGHFSSADASKKVLALYDEAAQDLRDRINRRK